ncbi:MAG: hypothetical protein AMS17_10010 [Spirochaetes bacterium DG_61]|nr:MAG: hypothetical protein AMS17_10010 [Spirochaetes bacterium DG_61]
MKMVPSCESHKAALRVVLVILLIDVLQLAFIELHLSLNFFLSTVHSRGIAPAELLYLEVYGGEGCLPLHHESSKIKAMKRAIFSAPFLIAVFQGYVAKISL